MYRKLTWPFKEGANKKNNKNPSINHLIKKNDYYLKKEKKKVTKFLSHCICPNSSEYLSLF